MPVRDAESAFSPESVSALLPVAVEPEVLLLGRERLNVDLAGLLAAVAHTLADPSLELVASETASEIRDAAELGLEGIKVGSGFVDPAEVSDAKTLGVPIADRLQRVEPGIDVDVGRWR